MPASPNITAAARKLLAAERERYIANHPKSVALAARCQPHFLFGLPMHWMRDWPMPVPLFAQAAQGNRLVCADGLEYIDFCLGDTGAMYGHSPEPVARAIAEQAARGLTAMLPDERLGRVGELLAQRFGLPRWQIVLTASDANRFALRWLRAVTGRAKVLVFDGCYHGTVDDTLVDRREADGATLARASLLGQVHDLAQGTVVIPFNDLPALELALAAGDIACLLAEPALTNCGLVPPDAGFWPAAQSLCQRHGVLLALDETHTVSTGLGGYARLHGLSPDVLVVGKAVAGGLPTAVYGFSDELAARMEAVKAAAPPGHSGIGTTLAANLLQIAALEAQLSEVMTPGNHQHMDAMAARLQTGLEGVIRAHKQPWCITRLGARMELQFCADAPRSAAQSRAAFADELAAAMQLFMLNRGMLVTPFHHMLLVAPQAQTGDVERAVALLDAFLKALN